MAPVRSPAGVCFTRTAFAAALTAFLVIGAIDAAYGPLLRPVSTAFGVSLPVAGTLISIHFSGALAGVASTLALRRCLSGRALTMAALAALAAGCLTISEAGAWQALATGVFVTGAGFGAADFSLNELMARTEPRHRAGRLNALNAAFGAGAILGPVAVGILRSAALNVGFAVAAGIACVTAAGLCGLAAPAATAGQRRIPAGNPGPGRHSDPGGARRADTRPPGRTTGGRTTVALFGLAYLCYVGCAAGTAGWIPVHLPSLGYSAHIATAMTSGFWGALTLGRLGAIPFSRVIPPRLMVLVAIPALMICLALTAIPSAAPVAYVAAGFAAAPVFPLGLAWTAMAVPGDGRASIWALTGSLGGGVLGPAAVAALVSAAGIVTVPAVLAGFAAAAFAALVCIPRPRRSPGGWG